MSGAGFSLERALQLPFCAYNNVGQRRGIVF